MKAAFVVFDGLTFLDIIGPYDALSRLKTMKLMADFGWDFCATTPQVRDEEGLTVSVSKVAQPLADYDLIVVAGGFGTRRLQHDEAFLEWLRSAARVPLKTSVCTGSLLLGAAGFLRGKRATTHPGAFAELVPFCGEAVHDRIVDEGDVVTAGGVSAGIDLGLHLVERFAGREARDRAARQMDYPWRAPAAGSARAAAKS